MTLAERLRAPSLDERRGAITEIAMRERVDSDELEALVACLGDGAKAVQRPAAEACRALAARGVRVEPLLLAALDAEDTRLRFGAAYALGRLGVPPARTLPALLAALALDDGDIRWAAAETICRVEPRPATVQALLPLVQTGNPPQRKMALYCLRDIATPGAAVDEAALAALDDPDLGVRLAAMTTSARLSRDRPRVAQELLRRLTAADAREQRAAAAALGDLGVRSEPVRTALEAAAASADPSLGRAAKRTLRKLDELA
jgi:HEAT repeat protein